MAFILECLDKPGALDTRLANRPAHLAYIEANIAKVMIAGPILTEEGSPIGSLLVLDFDTKAEVEAFAAADPYAQAGLFASTTIRPFRKVFPAA
ncbi:YciI family protein [Aerophototrophica crusticola]|uniref:YciI family protein n=1 Tax=Aerophototrophica crusticola TaxID=1709002 RepID=A0A858R7N8_9PROT|nr:YciI family protein [Rhodospirillaceae bacterium B3]